MINRKASTVLVEPAADVTQGNPIKSSRLFIAHFITSADVSQVVLRFLFHALAMIRCALLSPDSIQVTQPICLVVPAHFFPITNTFRHYGWLAHTPGAMSTSAIL